MNKKIFVPMCVLVGCLTLQPRSASSRVTSIFGGVGVEQEYTSNVFHEDKHESTQWTTLLLPIFTVVSEGSRDSLELSAGSGLLWNQRVDERDFAHELSFVGTRQIGQYLQLTVSDDYSYYDDHPRQDFDDGLTYSQKFQRAGRTEQEEVFRLLFSDYPEEYDPALHYTLVLSEIDLRYSLAPPSVQSQVDGYLSNSEFRRRYWTNELTIQTEYEFAQDSILRLGYSYENLDDRTAQMIEPYEHRPSFGISYRFNQMWKASVDYEYSRIQYDQANDFTGNDTTVTLDYIVGPADRLNFTYDYLKSSYDGDGTDLTEQTGELGWDHDFSKHLHLSSSADVNYIARNIGANNLVSGIVGDERGAGFDINLSRDLTRGAVSIGAEGDYALIKLNDSWEDIRQSWSIDGAVSYSLRQGLSATFDVSYGMRYFWPLAASKETYDDYETGITLSYTFFRWYTVSLEYSFNKLDTHSSPISNYQEHTVMLSLFGAKDLFRW